MKDGGQIDDFSTFLKSNAEFGQYYYRARYYDQNIGRFISEDPLGFAAGPNSYTYVHNNPPSLDDPTGLCDKDKNCQLSISCGQTPRTEGYLHCTVTIQNGSTYTAYDAGATGGGWWIFPEIVWGRLQFGRGTGTPPGPNSFVKNVPVPCDCADKAMKDINSNNLVYNFVFQNSNTAAAMMAADCGVYPTFPAGAVGAPMALRPK